MSFFKPKTYDFVGIGDTVTDAFIRLKDPHIHARLDHNEQELCMSFGSKIPYEFVEVVKAVGNSANAAVSSARLGLSTALVTDLGEDINGNDAIEALKKNGVETKYVRKHKGMETNYHYVLWYAEDRTILIKHQEYPYKFPHDLSTKWIYLSSFGEHSLPYHDEIATYLEKNPQVKLAFQPGTFQIKIGTERLKRIYARTEAFFCNLEEAQTILGSKSEIKELLHGIAKLGPKIVVITDGPNGAYTFDGQEMLKMPEYPDPKPPYERTGAGDAFASTFVAALGLGKSVKEALMWGPVNSMSVVQYVGAQKGLLSREALEKYLKEGPADYKPTILS
ncbi:MAG: PfkB family carbohydrate kinase [Candidatus Pacebacteria bacterium]|nr:PfkB family carbohydrate kinase [Candidatus Paceibacterota bacterium]